MDAKRLIPVVRVRGGRVVEPGTGFDLGLPSAWARRLEMEGADEILFRDRDGDGAWVTDVARALFIPFAVEAPFRGEEGLHRLLAQGADKVVVPGGPEGPGFLGPALGRSRLIASLEATWSPGDGWRQAMETMTDLGRAWAGEVLVSAGTKALGELSAQADLLPMPFLLACTDPLLAALALAQGADGIAFPAALMRTGDFKALLSPGGTQFRG